MTPSAMPAAAAVPEVGQALHLAETTVKTQVGHLLAKLGLPDRVHLVIFAYESDLLEPGTI
jgi:DNA-binding NarL/FixJ family response regulator